MERKETTEMKRNLLAITIASLLVLAGGCQWLDNGTAPVSADKEQVIDLDSPTGGFTLTDEEPAFGEPELFEPMFNEVAVDDTTSDNAQVKELFRHRHVKIFRMRAIWGHLVTTYADEAERDEDYCPLDWSGTMRLDGGAVIVERIIAFEEEDSVERESVSTINWVSHTGPHVDGLQVMLVVPWGPADSTEEWIEPKFVFESGPYSKEFSVSELMAMSLLEPVDDCGNGITINSHILPAFCPYGFLAGGWKSVEPDTTEAGNVILGLYRGIWISERGTPGGYLKGAFGTNTSGETVFIGKYIDLTGKFKGILRGIYGICPELVAEAEYPYGYFRGVWINEDDTASGGLKGHWVAREEGFGFFHGVWGMNCTEDTVDEDN
jgi:hypothetical protein